MVHVISLSVLLVMERNQPLQYNIIHVATITCINVDEDNDDEYVNNNNGPVSFLFILLFKFFYC